MEGFKTWFWKYFLGKIGIRYHFWKNGQYGPLSVPVEPPVTKTEAWQLYQKQKLIIVSGLGSQKTLLHGFRQRPKPWNYSNVWVLFLDSGLSW